MRLEKEQAGDYDPSQFDRPSVTTDVLVFTIIGGRLHLLLEKRGISPFKGKWALPGGFIRIDESADEAAERVLFEETGVKSAHMEQLYTFSSVKRDPRMRVLSIAYIAAVPYDRIGFTPGRDVEEVGLFEVAGIEGDGIDTGAEGAVEEDCSGFMLVSSEGRTVLKENIAFDHSMIIRTAVLRLRGKLMYTDIAFRFLDNPSSFTLTQLRNIYEAILDTKLDIGNFRRMILREYAEKGKIEELGDGTGGDGIPAVLTGSVGRPAILYRTSF